MNRLAARWLLLPMQPLLSAKGCSCSQSIGYVSVRRVSHSSRPILRSRTPIASACAGSSNVQYNTALASLTSSMAMLHTRPGISSTSLGHYTHLSSRHKSISCPTVGSATVVAAGRSQGSGQRSNARKPFEPLRLLSKEELQQPRQEQKQQQKRSLSTATRQTKLQQQQQLQGSDVDAQRSTHAEPVQHKQQVPSRAQEQHEQLQPQQQPIAQTSAPLPLNPSQQQTLTYLRSIQSQWSPLSDERLSAVAEYLSELNQEQWKAVMCDKQHLRLIAGPGSGKTRTITARVAFLLANNTPPDRFLVITFTRKAAGELVERIQSLMGQGVTRSLRPCTFHALCNSLLRKYESKMNMRGFAIATQEDTYDIVESIVYPNGKPSAKDTNQGKVQPNQFTQALSSKDGKKEKDPVRFYLSAISRLKNFVQEIEGCPGAVLIATIKSAGLRLFSPQLEPQLAQVYDLYQQKMRQNMLLDFDDLLHKCLHLVKNDPQVKASLHSRFKHVLVDESQDTNPCQFELVKQITGPDSNLFMVGDPDQAIYGFRGANSNLLAQVFTEHYRDTYHTRYLSQNYRSRPAIVMAADLVRRQLRHPDSHFKEGECVRHGRSESVLLLEAENQYEEMRQMIHQLKRWHAKGYVWGEMALLFRTRRGAQDMYRELIKANIPGHMPLGKDFWDSAEVKTAMALLRCLVQPDAAGDVIKRRLVKKQGLQVPIMLGLGDTKVAQLEAYITENGISTSSATKPDKQSTALGSCLFTGCFDSEMTPAEATAILHPWLQAAAPLSDNANVLEAPLDKLCHTPESDEVLQGLAPAWKGPEGFVTPRTFNKRARAVVERLRGLVALGRAAAITHPPAQVLQLLLTASGMWRSILEGVKEGDVDAIRRRANLKVLLTLAKNTRAYNTDFAAETEQLVSMLPLESGENAVAGGSSSSDWDDDYDFDDDDIDDDLSSPVLTGMAAVQSFYDFCVLQGESDEEADAALKKVQLLTMHGSKGKEFPCVGVMRVDDKTIPSLVDDDPTPNAMEQERNTLYVAMTRAKDHLVVSWPAAYSRYVKFLGNYEEFDVGPSRFLMPILKECRKGSLEDVRLKEQPGRKKHGRNMY